MMAPGDTILDVAPISRNAAAIRPVSRSDKPALKAVIEATGLFPADMLDDMMEPFFQQEAEAGTWLTFDDGAPVAITYHAPERMTVGTRNLLLIAVHPDRQSQGIGTALLQGIEAMLTASGERLLLVETSGQPAFERTRRFYRRCGYVEEARIRDFYQAGDDKIIFRKALTSSLT